MLSGCCDCWLDLKHATWAIALLYLDTSNWSLLSIDQKDRMEEENQSLVLTFGSQLDRSLKDLHKTILGSVSQQQNQLRCLEEHVHSSLASKCDVREILFLIYFSNAWLGFIINLMNTIKITRQRRFWNQGLRKYQRHTALEYQPWRS